MNKYHDTSLLDSYLSERIKRDAEHTRGIRVENDRKHAFNDALKFGAIILAIGIALYIALSGIGNALSFEQIKKNITSYDQNINGIPMQNIQMPGDELIDIEGLLNQESDETQNSEQSDNSSGEGDINQDFWGESENSSGEGDINQDFWGESENSSGDANKNTEETFEENLENENLDAAIRNYVIFDKYEMDIGNIYKLVIGRSYPEQGVSPDGKWCYVDLRFTDSSAEDRVHLIRVKGNERSLHSVSDEMLKLMDININQLEEVRAQCRI